MVPQSLRSSLLRCFPRLELAWVLMMTQALSQVLVQPSGKRLEQRPCLVSSGLLELELALVLQRVSTVLRPVQCGLVPVKESDVCLKEKRANRLSAA